MNCFGIQWRLHTGHFRARPPFTPNLDLLRPAAIYGTNKHSTVTTFSAVMRGEVGSKTKSA